MFACIFITSFVFAQDQVTGKWLTGDQEAVVEMFKTGDRLTGKIVWLKQPNDEKGKPLIDKENPDHSRQSRPLLGLIIIEDLSFKNGKWQGGHIYDPSEGKTYNCSVWLDNNTLKVRGYWGMLYQTESWTRHR